MEANYEKLQALVSELSQKVTHLEAVRSLASQYPDNTGFDTGDTAWMLAASALVLFMTLPGLFLYYGGMARTKNVISIIMQTVSTAALITLLWLAFGYSLCFAPPQGYEPRTSIFGNRDRFWFTDMKLRTWHQLAPTIPEAVFCVYQLAFAIITACLMIGAFADRMKFTSMLLVMALWHLTVYCPTAHSMWHPNGFLFHAGVLDYAGGNVVHITSGVSGLVTAIYLGPRKGFGKDRFDPHNILFTAVGACMLWVGWYGFNAGSAFKADDRAAMAMLMTQIACSMSALTWMINEWIIIGHPTVQGLVSGAVAGLVAITPGAGYVDHTGAFIIGLVSGPICYGGVQLKHWLGYDDALDAFGVHGVGGIAGGLLLGFFATDKITGHANGVFYSDTHNGGMQWGHQLYAIVVTAGWSIFMTTIILFVVDLILGLRVSAEQEEAGLDISLHNETLSAGEVTKKNVELVPTSEPAGIEVGADNQA